MFFLLRIHYHRSFLILNCLLTFFFLLFVVALSGCFSPYAGEEEGLLVISLGGAPTPGLSRSVVDPFTEQGHLFYEVTLSGAGGTNAKLLTPASTP